MTKELKLGDRIYKVDKQKEVVEVHKVFGIYNLEKIKQDKESYYFDAPEQLIFSSPNIEDDIYKGPMERYSFKNITEMSSDLYYTQDEAQKALNSFIERKHKNDVKNKKITELEEQIEILKNTD